MTENSKKRGRPKKSQSPTLKEMAKIVQVEEQSGIVDPKDPTGPSPVTQSVHKVIPGDSYIESGVGGGAPPPESVGPPALPQGSVVAEAPPQGQNVEGEESSSPQPTILSKEGDVRAPATTQESVGGEAPLQGQGVESEDPSGPPPITHSHHKVIRAERSDSYIESGVGGEAPRQGEPVESVDSTSPPPITETEGKVISQDSNIESGVGGEAPPQGETEEAKGSDPNSLPLEVTPEVVLHDSFDISAYNLELDYQADQIWSNQRKIASQKEAVNKVQGHYVVSDANKVWCSDWTVGHDGKLSILLVLDLASRLIISSSIHDKQPNTEDIIEVLLRGMEEYKVIPEIFHTDCGGAYMSND